MPSFTPGAAGTLTLRMYDAASSGTLVTYASFTVAAAQQTPAVTFSGVPTSGSATLPLSGGTWTETNGSAPWFALWNGSADQGSRVQGSGTSGSAPSLTPSAAGTYEVRAYSAQTGGSVLGQSAAITVGAAPDVVLSGLPASIAAGQPLSGTTFVTNNEAYGDFVLWDQTAGAIDGAALIADTVTPDSTLDFLVPQNAGHTYTVRLVSTDGSTVVWESASFSVTAAPGALPAQVSGFNTSGATTTQVTLNWSAVSGATGYQVLARVGVGSANNWGSLANTVVSGTSYTFTGLSAGAFFFPIVTAINANGRGPANQTTAGTASS